MQTHVWALTLVLLAGLVLPAQAQTKLEWKFTEGEKFYIEEVSDRKQQISVAGPNIKMSSKMSNKTTNVSSYTVKRVVGGAVTMAMKVEFMKVKVDPNRVGVDMEKLQEKLQGATFTFTLDGGQITKFQGYEEFLKKLTDGDEMAAGYFKMFFTEDLVKKGIEEAFTHLPTGAVNRGDKWIKDRLVPLGLPSKCKLVNQYTLKGTEADGDLITYTGSPSWVADKDEARIGSMIQFTKVNFKSDNVRGSLVFDTKAGRLVRTSNSMTITGSMTYKVMGNDMEMQITWDTATTTRILRKNPRLN